MVRRRLITGHQFHHRCRRRSTWLGDEIVFEGAQFTNISSLAEGCVPLAGHFLEPGRRALAFPLPLPSSWVSSTEISVVKPAMEPRIYTARTYSARSVTYGNTGLSTDAL